MRILVGLALRRVRTVRIVLSYDYDCDLLVLGVQVNEMVGPQYKYTSKREE